MSMYDVQLLSNYIVVKWRLKLFAKKLKLASQHTASLFNKAINLTYRNLIIRSILRIRDVRACGFTELQIENL